MWKFDFPPRALLWLLGITLAIGVGVRGYEWLTHRRAEFPLVVVRDESTAREIRAAVDSILQKRKAETRGPIAINQASATLFESLDGIGPVLAARIVEYRGAHGPFRSVDDLLNVPGIGPKRLEAIRERCMVDSSEIAR